MRGKHKPTYTPHIDSGDFVIVINAKMFASPGERTSRRSITGTPCYPGGLKMRTAAEMRQTRPEKMVELAVWGMLPHRWVVARSAN